VDPAALFPLSLQATPTHLHPPHTPTPTPHPHHATQVHEGGGRRRRGEGLQLHHPHGQAVGALTFVLSYVLTPGPRLLCAGLQCGYRLGAERAGCRWRQHGRPVAVCERAVVRCGVLRGGCVARRAAEWSCRVAFLHVRACCEAGAPGVQPGLLGAERGHRLRGGSERGLFQLLGPAPASCYRCLGALLCFGHACAGGGALAAAGPRLHPAAPRGVTCSKRCERRMWGDLGIFALHRSGAAFACTIGCGVYALASAFG
jgi:hypothetical protein